MPPLCRIYTLLLLVGCSPAQSATLATQAEPAASSVSPSTQSEPLVLVQDPDAHTPSPEPGRTAKPTRDPWAAEKLANEGDQRVRVNLSAAIEKYRQAIALEPDNAVWHWKLFAAFRRVGDYKAQVDSLLTAEKLEPGESRYSQQLAVARTHLAQAGDVTQWPLALEAAKRCLGLDVSIVDCEHHAALAEGATANVDSALIRHRKTLALEPANARYHLAYVSLLVEQQRNTEARQAIAVARRDAQRVQKFQAPLFTLEMLSHQLALRMRDTKEVLNSLEQADRLGGDSHPEVAFALGIAYADASPAQTDKARLLLKTFVKRVCHGAKRPQFEAECSAAEHRIERLAGQVP